MKLRHPDVVLEEIPGCGHAPSLMVREQIDLVRGFLEAPVHWRDEDKLVAAARAVV